MAQMAGRANVDFYIGLALKMKGSIKLSIVMCPFSQSLMKLCSVLILNSSPLDSTMEQLNMLMLPMVSGGKKA